MSLRPLLLAVLAVVLALPAAAQTLQAQLDVSFRGLTGGSIGISARESGGRYSVAAHGRPTGVMGALVDYSYDGETRGIVSGDRYLSESYHEVELDRGERTVATTTFRDGRVTGVTFTPPRTPEPYDLDPTAQSGVIDTLTALYLLLKPTQPDQACGQQFRQDGGIVLVVADVILNARCLPATLLHGDNHRLHLAMLDRPVPLWKYCPWLLLPA